MQMDELFSHADSLAQATNDRADAGGSQRVLTITRLADKPVSDSPQPIDSTQNGSGLLGGKMPIVDFAVVGGGIVGLATAVTLLQRRPGASLVLLEKEAGVAQHQTGHNSGVIHAGIYYEPGSLKARLCKAGAAWTRQFCDEQGIEYRDTGKLIVATNAVEVRRLENLYQRALRNELAVERVSAAELREREPHVAGLAAILLRTTGVVDYRRVSQALAERIVELDGELRTGAEVTGIEERPDRVEVSVRIDGAAEQVSARQLVVCGGLQADRLARMGGVGGGFQIVPFRGEYYRLPAHRNGLVSTLIYPVPDPDLPFLGVHLTLAPDGGLTVGPNAVLGLAREGYPKFMLNLRDVAELARFPGFWRLAKGQLRTGVREQWDSLVKPGYLRQVRKYCPELTVADLQPEPAGIRAQAVLSDGSMVHDFLFRSTARSLHVCNAPSPAATSAMPIASLIADRLLDA